MNYMFAVCLISCSLMALEICLTRVFTCMIWYHLSFFTITLAMLGFSLGGLVLLAYPSLKHPREMRTVSYCTTLFAVCVAAGTLYILYQPQIIQILDSWFRLSGKINAIIYFFIMIALFTFAFISSGIAISTAITQKVTKVDRIYFSNLIGSGLGCILIIGTLSYFDAFKSMLLIISLAAFASILFGGLYRLSKSLYALNIIMLLGSLSCFALMDSSTIFARSLFVRHDITDSNRVYREWNSFSVVDFYRPEEGDPTDYEGLWGLSSTYTGKLPERIKVIIDSWAITSIYKGDQNTIGLNVFDYLPSNLAYRLKTRPDVLIIGAGGGIDVLAALHYDASSISAVEINPSIVKAVKTRFADFAGHIYDHPKVKVINDEGRHVISRDNNSYDMIQLTGVDTLSGAQASSYSFSESYLYTCEAFRVYWEHLKPDGIITFLRFELDKPRETLRLFATAAETLRDQGVRDISRHVVVIHSNRHVFAITLLKKSPFSQEELGEIEKAVEQNRYRFLFHPDKILGNEFDAFMSSDDWRTYYAEYPYRISPVRDDNPFFFFYAKFADLFSLPDPFIYYVYWVGQTILFYGGALVLLLSVVFVGWPLYRLRRLGRLIQGKYRFIVYFLCIGLAFMFVEIILMQRLTLLLGQPIYSLALVLCCMMIFAGIGSYCSKRLMDNSLIGPTASFILLILVLLATHFLAGWISDVFLKSSLLVRIGISIVLIAPSSFLMGMPFPLGISIAHESSPEMVPWGWTINGYASVLGSILSVICGIIFGFTAGYIIAVVLYGLSVLIILSLRRELAS